MSYFQTIVILIISGLLWLLPVPDLQYAFCTDQSEESFTVVTDPAETTEDVTLVFEIYNNNTNTLELTSDLETDTVAFSSYDSTTKTVTISGLDDDNTRTITVAYDYWVLPNETVLQKVFAFFYLVWIITLIALPLGSIAITVTEHLRRR